MTSQSFEYNFLLSLTVLQSKGLYWCSWNILFSYLDPVGAVWCYVWYVYPMKGYRFSFSLLKTAFQKFKLIIDNCLHDVYN